MDESGSEPARLVALRPERALGSRGPRGRNVVISSHLRPSRAAVGTLAPSVWSLLAARPLRPQGALRNGGRPLPQGARGEAPGAFGAFAVRPLSPGLLA